MNIPFARVDCSGNEIDYVTQVLQSGWLTTASKTLELEKRFAGWVGGRYACAVNSCTAALHLGLEALGIGPGDEVLVQSMTFTASAEVVRYLGADPVFLDCDPETRLLTPELIGKGLRDHPRTRAVIVVHFAGQPAQMTDQDGRAGILNVCRKYGVRVLEDAAHAFPARHAGRMVGSFGDVTCFSFYANKTMTTGEGGMVVTDDEALWDRVKTMRLHGINRDVWDRFTSRSSSWEYDVVAPGFKYNMPDVNAAIGLAQLERAGMMRARREECARYYDRNLCDVPGLDLPLNRCDPQDHAFHLYPVLITPEAPLSRNEVMERLASMGIGTSVHYKPLHRMSYYRKAYNLRAEDFPHSERIWQQTLSLPIYPTLKDEELDVICRALRAVVQGE